MWETKDEWVFSRMGMSVCLKVPLIVISDQQLLSPEKLGMCMQCDS